MMFTGIKSGLCTYQKVIIKAFCEYIDVFMKIFLDYIIIFNDLSTHIKKFIKKNSSVENMALISMYSCRLLNFAKKNYITTKKNKIMVYVLHKFRHYLLGNKFVLYVDHMALMYLVNKPHVF
jgi:hypothetical protein